MKERLARIRATVMDFDQEENKENQGPQWILTKKTNWYENYEIKKMWIFLPLGKFLNWKFW